MRRAGQRRAVGAGRCSSSHGVVSSDGGQRSFSWTNLEATEDRYFVFFGGHKFRLPEPVRVRGGRPSTPRAALRHVLPPPPTLSTSLSTRMRHVARSSQESQHGRRGPIGLSCLETQELRNVRSNFQGQSDQANQEPLCGTHYLNINTTKIPH